MTRAICRRTLNDPRLPQVLRVWRENGLGKGTITGYLGRLRFFFEAHPQATDADITREAADRFAAHHVRKHGVNPAITHAAVRSALQAWGWGLRACGASVPPWKPKPPAKRLSPLLAAFADYRRSYRGVVPGSIDRDVTTLSEFFGFLKARGRAPTRPRLTDIDDYIMSLSGKLARRTIERACASMRAYLRFLKVQGLLRYDLATSVIGPRCRRSERPPRALAWPDVCAILRAVDRRSPTGRRDYALLLTMACYGLGSGEARGLLLDDIDWAKGELRVRRPKTRREIRLPLLPAVSAALLRYLKIGRPRHTTSRAVFVQMHAPYGALSASSAVRHVLVKHARVAGIRGPFLGSHALRHSHATRQIELGTPQVLVGDILGHGSPRSTSAYIGVALDRLRALSLPVPR